MLSLLTTAWAASQLVSYTQSEMLWVVVSIAHEARKDSLGSS